MKCNETSVLRLTSLRAVLMFVFPHVSEQLEIRASEQLWSY